MFLSDVSIKRPVFATILNLVLIVFGFFSYTKLGVELIPNIDFPVISVQVVYPGADTGSVEQDVIKPMEKALNGLEGLDRFSAVAYPSLGQVTLVFKIGVPAAKAAQDVRDKLGTVVLPTDAQAPIVLKFDMGAQAVLNLSLSSKNPKIDLATLARDRLKPLLEQVDGVGSVDIIGMREREIHVDVDRAKLLAYGLSPTQVVQAIQSQSLDFPSGKIENSKEILRIRTEGKANTLADLRNIAINVRGQKVRISDIATLSNTIADEETYASYNGNESLLLLVKKQSGGNQVALSKMARKRIDELATTLPEGVKIEVIRDTSKYIESALDSVKVDLVLGALLAIVIVFFFLHDWRATVISAAAIPTAVIGTVAFVYSFGFTLNIITSLALTLSIGILVDDAIVVIENIYRRIQMGEPPAEAARKGTAEIGLAALAITLSIVAVFGPVAYMSGIIGQFFRSFGITVAVAVLLSLFVAFTLTPMMGSRILKEGGHEHTPSFFKPIARALNATDEFYRRVLTVALRNRWKVVAGGIAVLFLTLVLAKFLPMSFFPKEDQSEITVNYTLVEGTSLTATKQKIAVVDKWIREYPGVLATITTIGASQDKKPNQASITVKLVPKNERNFTQMDIASRLRQDIARTFLKPEENVDIAEGAQGGGGSGQKAIQLVIMGNDYAQIAKIATDVKDSIKGIPGVVDASTTEPPQAMEYRIVMDRVRAADLGLSTFQIGQAIRSLYEGQKVATYEDNGLELPVMLRLSGVDSQDAASLRSLQIPNPMGSTIALSSIAHIEKAPAPSRIERYSGMRSVQITANYAGKDLAAVMKVLEAETKKRMTSETTYSVEGQGRIMAESMQSFASTLLLAIVLVWMVLAAQFESYMTPLVIMLSVSLSFVGAILGLLITGREFSMYPMIGILLLVGIVTKNAILLVDFALQRMRTGMTVNDALLEAGPIRLRPILMTTFAMIFGMLPIVFGHGEGGEARAPMAIAVIGGLITSTVLTLVIIPCVFSLFQSVKTRYYGDKLLQHT